MADAAAPTTDIAGGNTNDDPKPVRNPRLAYVFQPGRDHFPAKPYYEDGDPTMYSEQNMEAREELRDNPNVRFAIQDFVQKQFTGLTGAAKLCSKEEYCRVFMKVGQILRPGVDTDDLAKLINEDFDSDQQPRKRRKKASDGDEDEEDKQEPEEQEVEPPKNTDSLTEEQLHDALFELADTWCPSISEDEYMEFFELLYQRMLYSN